MKLLIYRIIVSSVTMIWLPILIKQLHPKSRLSLNYVAGFLLFLVQLFARIYFDPEVSTTALQIAAPIIITVLSTKNFGNSIIIMSIFYFLGIFLEFIITIPALILMSYIAPGVNLMEEIYLLTPVEVIINVMALVTTTKIIPTKKLAEKYLSAYRHIILLASINVYTTVLSMKLLRITNLKNIYVLIALFLVYAFVNIYIGIEYVSANRKKRIFETNSAVTRNIALQLMDIQAVHNKYREKLNLSDFWIDEYINMEDRFTACYLISKQVQLREKGKELKTKCSISEAIEQSDFEKIMHLIELYLDEKNEKYELTVLQDKDELKITMDKYRLTVWEKVFCMLNNVKWEVTSNKLTYSLRRSHA